MKNKICLEFRDGAMQFITEHIKNTTMTVTDIAKHFNTSTRAVQRLMQKHGINRTVAQANKLTAKLKDYSALRKPEHLKAKRNKLPLKLRYKMICEQPFCSLCGIKAKDCPMQIDHIDNDATNNNEDNLQVLCMLCNQGKK